MTGARTAGTARQASLLGGGDHTAVRSPDQGDGIGSRLLNEDWAVAEAPIDEDTGKKDGHVLILSAQAAYEAPKGEESGNWWLSRLRQRELLVKRASQLKQEPNGKCYHKQDELAQRRKLPEGLWLPWHMASRAAASSYSRSTSARSTQRGWRR